MLCYLHYANTQRKKSHRWRVQKRNLYTYEEGTAVAETHGRMNR